MKVPSARSTAANVATLLHRRDLLNVSALSGCGEVSSRTLLTEAFSAQQARRLQHLLEAAIAPEDPRAVSPGAAKLEG
jgi:hypothetical protein